MKVQWAGEACDRRYDPESGAFITQLTSSAATSINIYCEQPYTSPDGNRIAVLRRCDVSFDPSWRLIVADLTTLKLALIEPSGVIGVCNAAWSGLLHYTTESGAMLRLNLETLEKEPVALPPQTQLEGRGASVSPDQRYVVDTRIVDGPAIGIALVDLKEGREDIIFRHPEIVNAHLQFNPVHGRDILVQHNRGSRMDAEGNITRIVSEEGTTHFVIARDGSNVRPLPCGPPHTGPSTGHSNWVADTGRVAWTAHWNWRNWSLSELNPDGNLYTAAPGDARPWSIRAPEHRFNHINVSRCGRYFVCDSVPHTLYDGRGELRPPCIIVGNLSTGKYRTLVQNAMASNGGGQHQHPHPYLTADNRNVIYNSDPCYGPTQVWAARIPDGFLTSLD
jgi:hypothetical protein